MEGNISVVSFGTEESAETAIGEINKIERYATKKLGQNKQNNTPRSETTKEQIKSNQLGTQYYACKVEDHEIKDFKKRRNVLLRYTGSRYISTK